MNYYNNKRAIRTASDIQARNKIYKTSIDSWKNYQKYVNKYVDKVMQKLIDSFKKKTGAEVR